MAHVLFKHTKGQSAELLLLHGDITKVSADIIVTGEHRQLERASFVTKSLLRLRPEFHEIRQELLKKKKGLKLWHAYITEMGYPFRLVIHAVMDTGNNDQWLKLMRQLYSRIFQEADQTYTCHSIALPILGAGASDSDKALATKALASALCDYTPGNITQILVVSNDMNLLEMIEGRYKHAIHQPEPKQGYFQSLFSEIKDYVMEPSYWDEEKKEYDSQKVQKKEEQDFQTALQKSMADVSLTASTTVYEADSYIHFENGWMLTADNNRDTSNQSDKYLQCPICLNVIETPKLLDKCGHIFCKDCTDRSFREYKPVCPSCNMVYGVITGNQPDGQMDVGYSGEHLPGYEGHGTITITYYFPSGTQGHGHPHPGQHFKGTKHQTFLPDNTEGREVLKLLRTAFDRKLVFTISQSTTSGQDSVVTCKDIHHKTNMTGGPTSCGYPDQTYLLRVRDQLCSKGVMEPKQGITEETPIREDCSGRVIMKQRSSSDGSFNPTHNKTPEEDIKTITAEFVDTEMLREVVRRKDLGMMEIKASSDSILISLGQQVSHVLKNEIGCDTLRKMLTAYLREAGHLNQFHEGTTLDQYLGSMAENEDQDHILVSAAANVLKVEIVLIGQSGNELPFQPFEGTKDFLPTLYLGFIPPNHYTSLEQLKDYESDIPTHWSRMSKETELVLLQTGNTEYEEVKQKFVASIGSSKNKRTVKEIRRVQSVTQWKSYDLKRRQLSKQYPELEIERLLWHGTSRTSIKPICKDGFNRSYSGKNATRFGEGVYFSEMADYAARDTYSVPDTNGFKYIFLARVLTGMHTQGRRGMRVPPLLNEQEHVKFDSVVDNMDKPNMFVIFHDQQAYPEYLITFT